MLNRRIVAAATVDALLRVVETEQKTLNPDNVSTAMNRLCRIATTSERKSSLARDARMDILRAVVERETPCLDALGIALVMNAFSKLDQQPGEALLAVLGRRAEEVTKAMNARNIAILLNAYAKLGQQPGEALLAVLGQGCASGLLHHYFVAAPLLSCRYSCRYRTFGNGLSHSPIRSSRRSEMILKIV
eukprot:gene15275-biopygen4098